MRGSYALSARGSVSALRWMFPEFKGQFEAISPASSRHVFKPAEEPITVERELRQVCADWLIWPNWEQTSFRSGFRSSRSGSLETANP